MLGQREIYSFLQFECKSKIQNDIIMKEDVCYLIFIALNLYTFIAATTSNATTSAANKTWIKMAVVNKETPTVSVALVILRCQRASGCFPDHHCNFDLNSAIS